MPVYKYIAKDINGNNIKGKMNTSDSDELLNQIKDQELFLISYEMIADKQSSRMNGKELTDFNRELGTMLQSGITMLRALEIMLRRDISKKLRLILEKLYASLLSGNALSDSMQQQGKVFPELLINMYRSAEANGTTALTALRMGEHYEKEYRLKKQVKSAMTYPMVLLVLTIAVVILVFTFVLPNFTKLYGDMELPGLTKAVIAFSKLFTDYLLYLLLAVVLLIAAVKYIFQIKKVRRAYDKFKIKIPQIGKLMRTIVTARFSRTLSSLYASGLSILTTLQISKGTLGNAYIASQFDNMINDVRSGTALSEALDKIDGFDKKLAATVVVGEESGNLEHMLNTVADSFDYDASESIKKMLTILEPMMIVVMALVIGVVIIAVLLPIMTLYESLGA